MLAFFTKKKYCFYVAKKQVTNEWKIATPASLLKLTMPIFIRASRDFERRSARPVRRLFEQAS